MSTCPSCEDNTSRLWDISDLNTEFDEVCFSCKYEIQSELANELDNEQTMQDLYVWSCQFQGIIMTREELLLQIAESKIMFNREIMRQITNLPDHQFLVKRDKLLDLEIQLTEKEKEVLK